MVNPTPLHRELQEAFQTLECWVPSDYSHWVPWAQLTDEQTRASTAFCAEVSRARTEHPVSRWVDELFFDLSTLTGHLLYRHPPGPRDTPLAYAKQVERYVYDDALTGLPIHIFYRGTRIWKPYSERPWSARSW